MVGWLALDHGYTENKKKIEKKGVTIDNSNISERSKNFSVMNKKIPETEERNKMN